MLMFRLDVNESNFPPKCDETQSVGKSPKRPGE